MLSTIVVYTLKNSSQFLQYAEFVLGTVKLCSESVSQPLLQFLPETAQYIAALKKLFFAIQNDNPFILSNMNRSINSEHGKFKKLWKHPVNCALVRKPQIFLVPLTTAPPFEILNGLLIKLLDEQFWLGAHYRSIPEKVVHTLCVH